jgi:tol-pal system protein YbgF
MVRTLTFSIVLALAVPAAAQDRERTLADVRQDLTVLYVEIQKLKRELSTTGTPGVALGGTTALERVNAIETELRRLTAKTEELTNRIDRVVADGTNRIGDLEFRLVELEGGDVSKLGEGTTLGGEIEAERTAIAGAPVIAPAITPGAEMAVGEQADFNRAKEAYDAGSYDAAANQFQTFAATYTGGPLTTEAHFWRGKSLAALGNTSGAAKAYLEAYSGDPDGVMAPDALLELGLSLDSLGASEEACTMLGELTAKFPDSAASEEAEAARASMECA